MHEQSIVESLLAVSLEHAQKANARKIVRINVVVGELAGVVDEAISFYFSFLSKDTIAAEAVINFKHAPTQLRCRPCDRIFTPQKMDYHCPDCKGQQVDIVGGNELYIDSLDIE